MASRSWNKVELMGNLTRDPELRFTPNGAAVCTFGVATNRSYIASNGERQEDVDFHNLVAWNKLAELCNQLLRKGSRVFVSGRLQYREWESQDGQKKQRAEIVVEDMIVITPKSMGVTDESLDNLAETAAAQVAPASEKSSSKAKEAASTPVDDSSSSKAPPADETIDDSDLPF